MRQIPIKLNHPNQNIVLRTDPEYPMFSRPKITITNSESFVVYFPITKINYLFLSIFVNRSLESSITYASPIKGFKEFIFSKVAGYVSKLSKCVSSWHYNKGFLSNTTAYPCSENDLIFILTKGSFDIIGLSIHAP